MKKVMFAVILLLLSYSMLVSSFNIRLAAATGPVYIRADGSVDPPTSSIQRDGDLYTVIGNITSDSDGIVIERGNMTLDGDGFWLQGSGTGISMSGINNVTVIDMQTRGFSVGVLFDNCQNNTVFGNNITENGSYGIYLSGSSNNNVSQNRVVRYSDVGVSLGDSNYNSIIGNSVVEDVYGGTATGIRLGSSQYNILVGNTVSNNWIGIDLEWSLNAFLRSNSIISENQTVNPHGLSVGGEEGNILHYIHDIDSSNTIQGKPIYYWINEADETVPSNAGFVALVNCSRITVQNLKLARNWVGLLLFSTSDSTINSNEIANSYYGLWLYASSGNTFSKNNITSSDGYGIGLFAGSNNNRFVDNNVTWSNYVGIYHVGSLGTILEGNYIAKSYYIEGLGIVISQSASVNLTGNTVLDFPTEIVLGSGGNILIGNVISTTVGSGIVLWEGGNVLRTNMISCSLYSIIVSGSILDPSSFVNDVDSSNTVNGKPVYYWVDQHDMTVPSDAGYVFLVSCSGITVQNLNLTGEIQGVGLISTTSSTVSHNYLSGNDVGVQTFWSTGNSISDNTITGNLVKGIELREGSNNNIVSGNNMSSNGYGYNIIVMQSSGNIISGNYIQSSKTAGVYLLYSADDVVSGNDISGIWHDGGWKYGAIVLDETTSTLITGNSITQCNADGISLFGAQNNNITDNNIMQNLRSIRFEGVSSGNRIYRNNFVENGLWIVSSQPNSWDNGYPDGGNYWDTYADIDSYSGVGQNETGSDGIWDHQLNLTQDGNNIDHYPLMVPTVPIVRQFESYGRNVEVYSNSSISAFEFNVTAKAISFTVTGQTGTSGFCNVAVSKDLIWGTLTLCKDGLLLSEGVDYTRTDNSTHYIFHIVYSHSTHTIEITGTQAIPEFSSLITILPLLVSVMLLVVLVSKRRLRHLFSNTLDM